VKRLSEIRPRTNLEDGIGNAGTHPFFTIDLKQTGEPVAWQYAVLFRGNGRSPAMVGIRGGGPISTNRTSKQRTGGRLSQLAPNDFQKTPSEDRRKPTTVTTVTARTQILIEIAIDQPM